MDAAKLFYEAIYGGNLKVVEELLKSGINPDSFRDSNMRVVQNLYYSRDSNYAESPLIVAVRNKRADAAELLIRYGADVNSKFNAGDHILTFAVKYDHYDITKLLLINKAKVDSFSELLFGAVKEGHCRIVQLLLEFDAVKSIMSDSHKSLKYAINDDNKEIFELLLQNNANVNKPSGKYGVYPLHLATRRGNLEFCEMLLKKGAHVNAKQRRVEQHVWHYMNIGYVMDHSPTLSKSYSTPLHLAVGESRLEIAKMLIEHGAELDCTDGDGYTPLMIACRANSTQCVRLLLDSGSDINCGHNESFFDQVRKFQELSDEISMVLTCHSYKMDTVKMYVCAAFSSYTLFFMNSLSGFVESCKSELAHMKTEKIASDCNITVFEFLSKRLSKLAALAKNEHIIQALSSDHYKEKFPLYAGLITCNFRKGKERAMLLEKATKFFCTNMSFLPRTSTYLHRENSA